MALLGLFKFGAKNLGGIPQNTTKNFIEGVVVYRKSQKNFVQYINVYGKTSKILLEQVNIYQPGALFNLTESVLINKSANIDFVENVNIVLNNNIDFIENIDINAKDNNNLVENIDIYIIGITNLNENINVVYISQNDLVENVDIGYRNLKNLYENLTIQALKNTLLNEKVDVVYNDILNLTESVDIVTYHCNLSETVDITSIDLQGIILYEDAQHLIPIPNDNQTFLYNFGSCIEEEKIVPFYILNNRQILLSNMWVGISFNDIAQIYNEPMVFLSNNATDWTISDVNIGNLMPQTGDVFYVRLLPKLGINNQTVSVNFRIYKR